MAATRSLLVAALALALAPACGSSSSSGTVNDDPVGDTEDEGNARGNNLADHVAGELTGDEYTIVVGKTATILAALNDGEIDQASFAADVAVHPDTIDFASDLIVDHDDANAELDAVVRDYGIGYVPSTAADALAAESAAGVGLLRGTPPADVDFKFVELQVINHAEARVVLDELAVQVGDGEMGDFIANTRDMVDEHLDRAEAMLETYY